MQGDITSTITDVQHILETIRLSDLSTQWKVLIELFSRLEDLRMRDIILAIRYNMEESQKLQDKISKLINSQLYAEILILITKMESLLQETEEHGEELVRCVDSRVVELRKQYDLERLFGFTGEFSVVENFTIIKDQMAVLREGLHVVKDVLNALQDGHGVVDVVAESIRREGKKQGGCLLRFVVRVALYFVCKYAHIEIKDRAGVAQFFVEGISWLRSKRRTMLMTPGELIEHVVQETQAKLASTRASTFDLQRTIFASICAKLEELHLLPKADEVTERLKSVLQQHYADQYQSILGLVDAVKQNMDKLHELQELVIAILKSGQNSTQKVVDTMTQIEQVLQKSEELMEKLAVVKLPESITETELERKHFLSEWLIETKNRTSRLRECIHNINTHLPKSLKGEFVTVTKIVVDAMVIRNESIHSSIVKCLTKIALWLMPKILKVDPSKVEAKESVVVKAMTKSATWMQGGDLSKKREIKPK